MAMAHDRERHGRQPGKSDGPGRGRGEVDHATVHERATVVDSDDDRALRAAVGDLHHGPERQGAMGGGQSTSRGMLAIRGMSARVYRSNSGHPSSMMGSLRGAGQA